MSTLEVHKPSARRAYLRAFSLAEGISTTTVLDEETQRLFELDSSDPCPFIQTLIFIKKRVADEEAMEAALNALNIGSTPIAGGLIDRRLALMQKRAEEGPGFGEPETVRKMIQLEDRGFEHIAASYDMALELKAHHEFVKAIHKLANDNFTPVNMRRPLNLELDRLAVSLVS